MKVRIHMRSFAPWSSFGGILPGPDYVQITSRITSYNETNYDGDGRTFSVETDDPRITSRIKFEGVLDIETWKFDNVKVESDPSYGPKMLVGPLASAKAKPQARTMQYQLKNGTHIDVSISGANPLVPLAPDIDAACEYTFTHQTSSVVAEYIDVTTRVSGDQFPAFETFLSDTRGGKVFLGGFAPESRSPAQLARLFGELNQPRDIFFESSVRISIRDGQRFRDVSGSWRSSAQTAKGTTLGTMSADAWNKMLMEQFPMPIDGWLYGKRVGEEGTSIRWRSASSPGGQ
jgi:hypothetical protein